MATQVSYWQPGKLYQPGALVQKNSGEAVTQEQPTNAAFESGDTGWTKASPFTIGSGASFEGTQRAKYTGQPTGLAFFPIDFSGARIAIYNGTTAGTEAFAGTSMLPANNDTYVVAVGANTADESAWRTTDGAAWTEATTVPWGALDSDIYNVVWDANTALFYAFSNQTQYWTTPDGDVWTERTFPVNLTQNVYSYARSGIMYVVVGDAVYSTTTGLTGGWTLVTGALGFTPAALADSGTTLVAIHSNGSGAYEVWTSTDGLAWAENAAAGTNLEAAAADISNPVSLVYGKNTWVFMQHLGGTSTATDNLITSTDILNWTARDSFNSGGPVYYSEHLDRFLQWTINDSDDGVVNESADAITWTQNTVVTGVPAPAESPAAWAELELPAVTYKMTNQDRHAVFAGQIINATCRAQTSVDGFGFLGIAWYNSGGSLLRVDYGDSLSGASSNWRELEVSAIAPLAAATATVVCAATGGGDVLFDDVEWDYFEQGEKGGLIFRATQAAAGFSGSSEPAWPTAADGTVVDNEVTWTAVVANCIVWQAVPILLSGSSEPAFPTEEGAQVTDNTILWTAESGRVRDANCPNTKEVAIAASKIFCADDDIIAFSATVNPLDWSAEDDAGFIPFGLNTYGSEPVSALGIYRSNLVAFNSKAFQMWQVDQDPANFAILDAVPVGCPYYRSLSPVSNDLVFLSDEGIRSMGVAGASTNLAAGFFGKQIDPLVKATLAGMADLDGVISLFYPGAGQYWLIFGAEAFVLTMNGGKSDMSWSRYAFPSAIDDWTIKGTRLYLRSGDKVWEFDEDTLRDDEGGANVQFEGHLWWPYLDFGALGVTKQMIGFDVVADGTFTVSFGYNQKDASQFTTPYSIAGDTLTGDIIPMPLAAPSFQMRIEFAGNEAWKWSATALHLQDWRTTS